MRDALNRSNRSPRLQFSRIIPRFPTARRQYSLPLVPLDAYEGPMPEEIADRAG